jgi:adenine phosphoribosyltransferase
MTSDPFAETSMTEALKTRIRHVPDFPKAGILFYDVTTLLRDPDGFRMAIDQMTAPFEEAGIDLVVGIESRGFILGSAVADRLGTGFVPVRKLGKLPAATIRASYSLEYGTDSLEMHRDAITAGQRVLIVDDLLATGGTASAAVQLVKELGGTIAGVAFLIELVGLDGRSKLEGERVHVVLSY